MNDIKKSINLKNLVIFFGILFLFLTLDYILMISYYSFNDTVKNTVNKNVIFIILKYIILITIFIIQYHK